ncbi:MAG TPA: hypothetical protein VK034_17355 [Enhygromyxa sp.]|nr:hypothetical protein [Enhygromyxa sp.]
MVRRAVLVGFALALSLACDRFDFEGLKPEQAEPAEPAKTDEPEEAVVVAPTEPSASESPTVEPSPSEAPAVEPSPSEAPAVEPAAVEPAGAGKLPPMVGNAQQVLAALLAGIEVPEAAVKKDIRKRAWEDYLDYRYHDAGEGFALLTKLDPKSWEFPFAAARAAAGREEMERAQVFLVEALLRGGTEARDKANKEPTLRATRKLPWFADLIAADPAGLAAWEIREPPPLVISPYPPGESPVAIRNVEIASLPPGSKPHDPTKLKVAFDVEKLVADGAFWGMMITTCKVGDRYLHDEGYIVLDIRDYAVGQSKQIEAIVHDREWNEPRTFDMCEVEVIDQISTPSREYRWVARYCWTSAGTHEGPCPDFVRPVTDDIQVTRVSVQPRLYEAEPGVFIEWVYGRRPDRDTHLSVGFDCEVEGRQFKGVAVVHRTSDFGRPGSAMQASTMLSLNRRDPTRCDLEIYRGQGGPRDIPAGSRHCYEQGKTRAGRCGS